MFFSQVYPSHFCTSPWPNSLKSTTWWQRSRSPLSSALQQSCMLFWELPPSSRWGLRTCWMGCRLACQRICGKTERHHSSPQCICCEFICFLRVFFSCLDSTQTVEGMWGSNLNTTAISDDSKKHNPFRELSTPIHLKLPLLKFGKYET